MKINLEKFLNMLMDVYEEGILDGDITLQVLKQVREYDLENTKDNSDEK